MERMKSIAMLPALTAALWLLGGCASSNYQRSKQEMVQNWGKSSVQSSAAAIGTMLDRGEIEEAKKALVKCVQAAPDDPKVNFLLARVHLAEGRTNAAQFCLEKTVEADAEMDEAWFALGLIAQEQGNNLRAGECFQKAVQLQPLRVEYILALSHLYLNEGQTEEARQLIEEKRKQLPYNEDLLLTAAELSRRSGDSERAVILYKEALWKQGDNTRVLEALGLCLMDRQEWKQAAEVFEKLYRLLEDARQQESILHWLGYCSLQGGQYGQALKWYDRLSVLRREDPQVWLEMGQAALGADLPDRAAYCGQKALQIQPDLMEAEVVVACSLYLKKNYTDAIPLFQKICRDSKWEAFGWWMSGLCYQHLGQNALARGAFEKASRLSPESPLIRLFAGQEKKTL